MMIYDWYSFVVKFLARIMGQYGVGWDRRAEVTKALIFIGVYVYGFTNCLIPLLRLYLFLRAEHR
jgi:hypothetical protein